ncbi:MAG: hypothetical protein DRQ97_00680 [Gammaproteobacteria bacterium]|nr:MAG: hypothetical protein DRQ97_00680 [Gammaproteobacteria bacterium]
MAARQFWALYLSHEIQANKNGCLANTRCSANPIHTSFINYKKTDDHSDHKFFILISGEKLARKKRLVKQGFLAH